MIYSRLHKPCISLLTVILFALLSTAPNAAASPVISQIPVTQITSTVKLERINNQITAHTEKLKSTSDQQFNISQELNSIDQKLNNGQKKISSLQEKLLRQEGHIKKKERQLNILLEEKESIEDHVKNRLKSFYQMGEIGIVNTLFSSQTLPELINTNEYFQAMFDYDQRLITSFNTKIGLITGAKEAIGQEKDNLLQIILDLKQQETTLIANRNERSKLLERIKTEEELYRQALFQIKSSAAKLAETINNYSIPVIANNKRKITRSSPLTQIQSTEESGFIARKGSLLPPAYGTISRRFGTSDPSLPLGDTANGIDIKIQGSSEVKAIFQGDIVFSGHLEGYGKMIIIGHGNQYFSMTSGLEKLSKDKDDQVKEGEVIGFFGMPSGLLSSDLHFEIRHETVPVDPLLWLDKSKFIQEIGVF